MSFQGYVSLGGTFRGTIICKDGSLTPTEPAALPTWRCYGSGYLINGTAAQLDTGTITNVVNNGSGACRVTDVAHGLTTGARITVSGVLGATGANITATITRISADDFDLDGSTFGGSYTSGGVWTLTGGHRISVAATAANGFAAGEIYVVVALFSVGGVQKGELVTFCVV